MHTFPTLHPVTPLLMPVIRLPQLAVVETWDSIVFDKPPSQTMATLGSLVVFTCKRSSQMVLLMVYTALLRAGQGHLSIQPLPNAACSTTPTAWEGLGYIGQGRLREAGSIYVAVGKPLSLLRKDFPVLAFGGGTPTPLT